MEYSDCFQHFGHEDFALDRVEKQDPRVCPVKNCATELISISYRKGSLKFCEAHGIRLHTNTFVYWNGPERKDEARLRNFRFRPDLASTVALGSEKVETHRLGYELSEDALSWNVFVALWEAGALRQTAEFLTGLAVVQEPQLYLWGRLISSAPSSGLFGPLNATRSRLETGIGKYKTEPDIMLVIDGTLLVSVEAKFSSGNPLAHAGRTAEGEKPEDQAGLVARYYDNAKNETKGVIDPKAIGERLHSQLFRNIVFASEMATEIGSGAKWHVVNLMSSTQAKRGKESREDSFRDAELDVQCYLREESRGCFTSRTWENLYRAVIQNNPSLSELDAYISSKSAHFLPAFSLR
jgi:hypothetical protein